MIKLSQEQRGERWDSLPDVLREAIVSEVNSDFIWKTCQAQFIPDEKIYDVMGITGLVLSGFMHPEDMAAELAELLKIDRRIADPIAAAISQRIFTPIRPEIDKVYNPTASSSTAPKIIQEAEPEPAPIASVAPQPPAPKPLPEKGWSTMKAADISPAQKTVPPPPMQFSQAPAKMPTGTPPVPAITTPPRPVPGAMSSGIVSPSKMPAPIVMPEAPKPIPMPRMMVQGIDAPKQIKNDPDFHITTRSTENIMPGGAAQTPLRNAVLELGNIPARTPAPTPTSQAPETAKTVHYSNLKSSLPTRMPTGNPPVAESGRQVMEMTAENFVPKVPMPKFMPSQSSAPASPAAKPVMPMPMPMNIPTSTAPKPPMPGMPTPPQPSVPKPIMTPMPTSIVPPRPPMPQPTPMGASLPKPPIAEKIIVKDFTAGK